MSEEGEAEEESRWFIYMLRTASGALYTGITVDLERRLSEHQAQGPRCARALRGKGPLTLVYSFSVAAQGDALRAEHAIKQLSKADKEKLVSAQSLNGLVEL